MAIYNGTLKYKGLEIVFWIDPKRHRAMIWNRAYSTQQFPTIFVKRLHDTDPERITERAKAFVDAYHPPTYTFNRRTHVSERHD